MCVHRSVRNQLWQAPNNISAIDAKTRNKSSTQRSFAFLWGLVSRKSNTIPQYLCITRAVPLIIIMQLLAGFARVDWLMGHNIHEHGFVSGTRNPRNRNGADIKSDIFALHVNVALQRVQNWASSFVHFFAIICDDEVDDDVIIFKLDITSSLRVQNKLIDDKNIHPLNTERLELYTHRINNVKKPSQSIVFDVIKTDRFTCRQHANKLKRRWIWPTYSWNALDQQQQPTTHLKYVHTRTWM